MASSSKTRKAPATCTKVSVSIPTEVLDAAIGQVKAGRAPSLSGYISEAVAQRVARDREPDEFIAFLRELDEELGPPGPEAQEWARQVLGL